MSTLEVTNTLQELQANTRVHDLEKLAAQPIPAERKYEIVEQSCDGHTWRREILGRGSYGPWEDMGLSARVPRLR
jgi:hypothetical protein